MPVRQVSCLPQRSVSPCLPQRPASPHYEKSSPSSEWRNWPAQLLVDGRAPARPKAPNRIRVQPPAHSPQQQPYLPQRISVQSPRPGRPHAQQFPQPQSPGPSPRQAPGSRPEAHMAQLVHLLGRPFFAELLAGPNQVCHAALAAAGALVEQAVHMGIDYRRLGQGWDHPVSRSQYRNGWHPSTTCVESRRRAQESQQHLCLAFKQVVQGRQNLKAAVVNAFLREIGAEGNEAVGRSASFAGVAAALEAELLLPLRCLNEAQSCMGHTFSGEPVPADKVQETVQAITKAVVSEPGGFAEWRYTCAVGRKQLEGLTAEQAKTWREPSSLAHAGALRTHECEKTELSLFWSTKIGGPSHGFDFEGQCLLPLLSNARNKVILLSDPALLSSPAARVHFRLLWARQASKLEPRLWLERLNYDHDLSEQEIQHEVWIAAVLSHALQKADAMQVPLSVDLALEEQLQAVVSARSQECRVLQVSETFVLRPSNGVCEASDYLNSRHDWVQLSEEDTPVRHRVLYMPGNFSGGVVQS
eukprot:gb/GFBE01038094.1/.p1 GENE.gb/GFBE01038094.1/~~gb/GFBE01038094.1/.p1  ORF type:complete len:529 (+),score=80.71 gb/GFBE01038094.1/:1-1587(+)